MKRTVLLAFLMMSLAATLHASGAPEAAPQPEQEPPAAAAAGNETKEEAPTDRSRLDRERKKTKAKIDEDLRKFEEMKTNILRDMGELDKPGK